MSRDGLQVTVVGWAASTPREVVGQGVAFTSFRVATTPRWYDTKQGAWADGRTEWFTVKAFREAAFNIAASIHKGQPVIVHGRLRTEEWVGENGPRTASVIDASAVGHDLMRGTAKFARRIHAGDGEGSVEREERAPVDDPWSTSPAPSVDGPPEPPGTDEVGEPVGPTGLADEVAEGGRAEEPRPVGTP
ncbi:single-stranded DNA-binding protein [Cellulomonas sp. APG4]|uniref:single-stranded DNA-binding protein n=1 Tax=Cellulomonas sp. APG4 TaxID=1538656 RepID=UPI00137A10AF|nr:single-stranded DNA-binding protein [Cellulomonas sp. APG4]NCT91704.1 single-stranded DNA-binding protein [Cellulomonas sp. APG4]